MSLWRAWRKEEEGWAWALYMYCACAGCVMWLCPYDSETDATMPGTFDSSYHDMEVAEELHCLSPAMCSGHEAVLGNGESSGGGPATSCSPEDPANEDEVDSGLYTVTSE